MVEDTDIMEDKVFTDLHLQDGITIPVTLILFFRREYRLDFMEPPVGKGFDGRVIETIGYLL